MSEIDQLHETLDHTIDQLYRQINRGQASTPRQDVNPLQHVFNRGNNHEDIVKIVTLYLHVPLLQCHKIKRVTQHKLYTN